MIKELFCYSQCSTVHTRITAFNDDNFMNIYNMFNFSLCFLLFAIPNVSFPAVLACCTSSEKVFQSNKTLWSHANKHIDYFCK